MKQLKVFLFSSVILATAIFAENAVAVSMTAQQTISQMTSVTGSVPKGDDREEPDNGYECEELYPLCEAYVE